MQFCTMEVDPQAEYELEKDGDVIFFTLDPVLGSYPDDIQVCFGFILGCFSRFRVLTLDFVLKLAHEYAEHEIQLLEPAMPAAWRALIDLKLLHPKEK